MSQALHPNQLRPGDLVREYRLLRRLGVGGFAIVFLAEHAGQRYAVKVALQPVSDTDEDHVDGWMRREAVSLEHVVHPNLLPVHELGRWPHPRTGYSFYVTDHVPGVNFREWCQQEGATPYQWVGVLCEVLRPLEVLHERGMCHRDLKAENILVREGDARPFLIDFGAVHLPCARPLTEGLAPGTIYCQPPEAVRFVVGKEALEQGSRFEARPSADLYAVGVLLYEALTGHHPFDPKLPVAQLLAAILSVSPPEPRQLNPEAPASLAALAMRLLAKEPGQRPASVRAVREELENLRTEEGQTPSWRAPSVPRTEKPEREGEKRGSPAAATSSLRAVRVRRPMKVFLTGALGLGLLGWVGWSLFQAGQLSSWKESRPHVESTAAVSPPPFDPGAQPVPSSQTHEPQSTADSETETPSRSCFLLRAVLGVTVAQLMGCATTPVVRADPVGYLDRCPPEARETPKKLGFHPKGIKSYLYGSFIRGGTSASSEVTLEEGGPLNLKAGPVTANVHAYNDQRALLMTGVAVTTKMRVYIQFDRVQSPDGTWLPICGTAVSTAEMVYGIPTREAVAFPDSPVDPAKVDHSPGTVVLNDPQFMTSIEPPEGGRRARIKVADPDAKADIHF